MNSVSLEGTANIFFPSKKRRLQYITFPFAWLLTSSRRVKHHHPIVIPLAWNKFSILKIFFHSPFYLTISENIINSV